VGTTQQICFGEEITAEYADDYFQNKPYDCKCGAPSYRKWSKTGGRTLKEAFDAIAVPNWAWKDDELVAALDAA
jgi:hypothetical protein